MENFTNLYSLSKTLRFELVPQPEINKDAGTNLLIRKLFKVPEENHHDIIKKDLLLAKSYKNVKRIIDCMHRNIIDEKLEKFKFNDEDFRFLNEKSDDENEVEDEKDKFAKLRKKIHEIFYEGLDSDFKYCAAQMFNAKLLNPERKNNNCILEKWLEETKTDKTKKAKYLDDVINEIKKEIMEDDDEKVWKIIDEDIKIMKGWFTYFSGFRKNRENVYSADKISTAIPYRIVNENFPIFKRNIENYSKISKNYPNLRKILDNMGAAEIFKLDYYNNCLTQDGIDVYNIEKLGAISMEQGSEQKKGINQIINEFVQKENKRIKDENERIDEENKNLPEEQKKEKLKKVKVAVFEKLKKQIMGKSKTKSFRFEVFENTQDIIDAINERLKLIEEKKLIVEIKNFLNDLDKADLNEVYLNEKSIGIISKKLFDYGRYIEFALEKWYDDKVNKNAKDKKAFLEAKQLPIRLIDDSLNYYLENYEQNEELKNKFNNNAGPIISYFKNPTITIFLKEINENGEETESTEEKDLFEELESRKKNIAHILNGTYNKDLLDEKECGGDVEKIKSFLDALLEFNYILSPFFVKDKNLETDAEFYNERTRLQDLIYEGDILALYNQTRNYITKKPYKLDKFKLNFENQMLLGGWSKNEEKVKCGVILRKKGMYYLAIIDSENKSVFENEEIYSENGEYEKMTMLAIKWKTLVGKAYIRDFNDKYSSHIFDYYIKQYKEYLSKNKILINELNSWIKNENEKKTQDNKNPDDRKVLKKIINYIKKNLNAEDVEKLINEITNISERTCTTVIDNLKKLIEKQFLNTYPVLKSFLEKNFESRTEFEEWKNAYAKEIYYINFGKKISEKKLYELAAPSNGDKPKIFLFRIHNNDYKPGHTGAKNLHTLYWEMLFDNKNLTDVSFKLNGAAEIFYREASILSNHYIHKKGDRVPKKFLEVDDNGIKRLEPVPGEIIKRLNNYFRENIPVEQWKEEDKKYKDNYSVVKKDNGIVKDERFTKDKILFHCPITINFKKPDNIKINDVVLRFLHKRDDVHIIGIDRGERHLIYLTMINKQSKIVDGMQFSLNEMERKYKYFENEEEKTKVQNINFQRLLKEKEGSRMEARKNWQTIENISNLKQGYLSLVIHQLAKLIVEKNAIVVLEDLNYGFKDSRAKVEKNIYQKFEKMLIDKLNYLVTDKNNLYEKGGVLNGYQLTNRVNAYKDIRRQCGFLFYVPPDYTSKICPVTGFVNLINTKYTSIKDARELLQCFNIFYDNNNKYFRFDFDYKEEKLSKFLSAKKINFNELTKTKWSLCSHDATRVIAKKVNNKWYKTPVNVNELLEKLINDKITDFKNKACLTEEICKIEDKNFFEKLLKYLTALLSLHHTWKDENGIEHDTIVSSVEYGPNEFFISSNASNDMPQNADANGAYNIARKGLWLLNKLNEIIDKTTDRDGNEIIDVKKFNELKNMKEEKEISEDGIEKTKRKSQWVPNNEWLKFVQSNLN